MKFSDSIGFIIWNLLYLLTLAVVVKGQCAKPVYGRGFGGSITENFYFLIHYEAFNFVFQRVAIYLF